MRERLLMGLFRDEFARTAGQESAKLLTAIPIIIMGFVLLICGRP